MLSNKPQNITKELWYYEEKKGINVIHEIRHNGKYIRTDQIIISWKKIRASLQRRDEKDERVKERK